MSQQAELSRAAAQLHAAATDARNIAARREVAVAETDSHGCAGAPRPGRPEPFQARRPVGDAGACYTGSRAAEPGPVTGGGPPVRARTFSAKPLQVPEARRFLKAILDGSPSASDALVCLSELVTNAISHSRSALPGGTIAVRVAVAERILHVEVEDWGGPWESTSAAREPHGRGLLVVDRLARAWGRTGDSVAGWTVWFEMER